MRQRLLVIPHIAAAIAAAIAVSTTTTRPVLATPASGFVGTTLAVGRFGDINVFNLLVPPDFWKSRHNRDLWLSLQKTRDPRTCTSKATYGRLEGALAGTRILATV